MTRILFLTQVLPYPLDAGPKVRAYYMLRYLAARHEVTLVSFVRPDDKPEYVDHLRGLAGAVHIVPIRRSLARNVRAGIRGLLTGLPIVIARDEMDEMAALLRRLVSETPFDVIHADQLSMAWWGRLAAEGSGRAGERESGGERVQGASGHPLTPSPPHPVTVLDEHNAIYALTERMAAEAGGLRRMVTQREAGAFRRYEADMVRSYDAVLTVTDEDRELLLDLFDPQERDFQAGKFTTVPICVDPGKVRPVAQSPAPSSQPPPTILHLGTMFWPPNVAGVLWFARTVLPLIWQREPAARFVVVGKNPPADVRALTADPRIEVTGYVADPQPFLQAADAFVVPLFSGGGMRVKILDAWLWGLPIVSTPIGAEGIDLRDGENILIAGDPVSFADATVRVLTDAALNQQFRVNGRRWVEQTYAWQAMYRRVDAVYARLLGPHDPTSRPVDPQDLSHPKSTFPLSHSPPLPLSQSPPHPLTMSSRSRLTPLIVTGAAAILYLATLSRHYTGDSIEYALAIELADPAHLLDPYHPLLHPLGLVVYRLWQAVGWTGQSLLPLQVLNALAGALCAGLLADIVRRLTGSAWLALLTGLGFAVSGGLWMLSVEAEFVTVPLAAALLVLWAIFAASPRRANRSSYVVLLALATALAFWSYASGAILALVVLTGILLDSRLSRSVRRRQALIYSGALLIAVVPATLIFLAQWSQGDWARVPAYFFSRGDYSRFALRDLPHEVYAFLRSLVLYPRLSLIGTTRQFLDQASPGGRGLFVACYGLVLLVVCAPLALAVRQRRSLLAAHRRPLAILAVWSAAYAVFAILWVPGDVSFWLPLLAAWWLLLALVLSVAGTQQPRSARRWLAGLAVAVVSLAVINGAFEILPRRDLSTNRPYQFAADVAAQTGATDIVLTRGDDISGLYLAYFAGRQVFYAAPGTLDRVRSYVASSPQAAARRVVAVDVDARRLGWWQALLADSRWHEVEEVVLPDSGLLIGVTPR